MVLQPFWWITFPPFLAFSVWVSLVCRIRWIDSLSPLRNERKHTQVHYISFLCSFQFLQKDYLLYPPSFILQSHLSLCWDERMIKIDSIVTQSSCLVILGERQSAYLFSFHIVLEKSILGINEWFSYAYHRIKKECIYVHFPIDWLQ